MSVSLGSSSAFPQTGGNRTVAAMATQIARYVGGESSADTVGFAHECIHEAIQKYNRVAWKFNRMQQDVTLVASTETYTLNSDFRSPLRAYLLDSNSARVGHNLVFVPYSSWTEWTANTNFETAIPSAYTVRVVHIDGLVTIWPPPGSSLSYPTMRMEYNKWIAVPADGSGPIDAPRDVVQAILDDARARLYEGRKSGPEVDRAIRRAEDSYLRASQQYRDFGEIPIYGAGT